MKESEPVPHSAHNFNLQCTEDLIEREGERDRHRQGEGHRGQKDQVWMVRPWRQKQKETNLRHSSAEKGTASALLSCGHR